MTQDYTRKSQRPQVAITEQADRMLEKARAQSESLGIPMSKGALASKAIMEVFG